MKRSCKRPGCEAPAAGRQHYCSPVCHIMAMSSRDGECWIWQGHKKKNKPHYGYISARRNGKRWVVKAHRFSYLTFRGDIPDECEVAHECNIGSCVNPRHLFLSEKIGNIAEMHDRKSSRRHVFLVATLLSLPG